MDSDKKNNQDQKDINNSNIEIDEKNYIDSSLTEEKLNPCENLVTVRPIEFQEFENSKPIKAIKKNLDIMQDVNLHISVELGKTVLSIKDVIDMEKKSIVELNKVAGEQVEIYANNKLVAKGEVIVIEDKFGVRIVNTITPKATI